MVSAGRDLRGSAPQKCCAARAYAVLSGRHHPWRRPCRAGTICNWGDSCGGSRPTYVAGTMGAAATVTASDGLVITACIITNRAVAYYSVCRGQSATAAAAIAVAVDADAVAAAASGADGRCRNGWLGCRGLRNAGLFRIVLNVLLLIDASLLPPPLASFTSAPALALSGMSERQ